MLARAAMNDTVKDIVISDDEIQKFYDENKASYFTIPERLRASHILISDDVSSSDVIKKIQADLQSGVSFDKIAREVSICPSAERGGDLGEFQAGQMVPEFETAVFALKDVGEISKP